MATFSPESYESGDEDVEEESSPLAEADTLKTDEDITADARLILIILLWTV